MGLGPYPAGLQARGQPVAVPDLGVWAGEHWCAFLPPLRGCPRAVALRLALILLVQKLNTVLMHTLLLFYALCYAGRCCQVEMHLLELKHLVLSLMGCARGAG